MEVLLHWLVPRFSNNHRARLIQPTGILSLIGLLLCFHLVITGINRFHPEVLGFASNITVGDLVNFTNQERAQAGISSLALSDKLSQAAAAKAADMFAHQYWAHTGPTGESPWSFINRTGYQYLYAGENLARDFADSKGVVAAWMKSPTHRDNIVNSRYKDVGFAVVNGKYGDYETTLVVQMFGALTGGAPTVEAPKSVLPTPAPTLEPKELISSSAGIVLNIQTPTGPRINPLDVTKNVVTAAMILLLIVFAVDGLIVFQKKIVRVSGHSLAHMIFLIVLLVALNLIGRGSIL